MNEYHANSHVTDLKSVGRAEPSHVPVILSASQSQDQLDHLSCHMPLMHVARQI